MAEANACEDLVVPCSTIWWFADQQTPIVSDKAGGTLDRQRRWAESPANDDVIRPAVARIMGRQFGSGCNHIDAIGDAELDGRPHQERRPFQRRIEQHAMQLLVVGQQRESRQPAAGTQIDQGASRIGNQRSKASGMIQVDAQRARAEESHGPSPFENGKKLLVSRQRALLLLRCRRRARSLPRRQRREPR